MRYKLVIAEKTSVAHRLAAVIGATARKDGYLEGNSWRVSWCVGHLAGLCLLYTSEGLLFYGSTILPFVDHFPKNTELYRIMTTKPQELKKKEDE